MKSFTGMLCLGMLMAATGARGAEPTARSESEAWYVRISPEVCETLHRQPLEAQQPLSYTVLGTAVTGTSKTQAGGQLQTDDETGGLRLAFEGKSVSTTKGLNSGAIIYSTTTTQFVAHAPIVFDPERGFRAGQVALLSANSKMKTDDIQSSKSGIAGTMIKKVAAKKVAASLADAEAQAREMAIKRIEGEVAVEVGKRLEALNRSYRKLRPAVALVCADAAPCRLVLHKGALLISSQPARQELHQLPDSVHHAELLVSAPMKDTALAKKLEDAKSSLKEPTAVKHDESWLVVGIGLR